MDHKITLAPAKQPDGSLIWTMDYEGKKGSSPSDYPVIVLEAKYGHKLIFTIDNPAGLSINFDPSMVSLGNGKTMHNAIWVQQHTKPQQAVLDNQIKAVDVQPTVLTVKDKNSGTPKTLKYQINFVDAGNNGAKTTPLDPEIKNGGGHISALQDYATIAAVVVAVALAILVARRFLGRRPATANRRNS